MADYDNRVARSSSGTAAGVVDAGLRAHMLRVYNYMLLGLVITGATAWLVSGTSLSPLFIGVTAAGKPTLTILWMGAFAGYFILGLVLSFGIQRMGVATAQTLFWVFAGLFGVAVAPILLAYTGASVAETFFITSATFGSMSLWGYTTRSDLTGLGSFLRMGLFGLIIAMLVNWYFNSPTANWVISILGV
ncbi:MAG: Bax inhibitor-1/YccA family protein, partial [Candidatus Binataceae bacterium]